MQLKIEDLRRHYASLSDEALRAINRTELVEIAQQCYDQELAQREPLKKNLPRPVVRVASELRSSVRVFGDDGVLYLMEDAATGEIRLSVLWEWLHKGAAFTDDDTDSGVRSGETLTRELFRQLLEEEHAKLLRADSNDVHDDSKTTTLPIARAIVEAYVLEPVKAPWYIDVLNLNLNVTDLSVAEERIRRFLDAFGQDGTRITRNLDFDSENH